MNDMYYSFLFATKSLPSRRKLTCEPKAAIISPMDEKAALREFNEIRIAEGLKHTS